MKGWYRRTAMKAVVLIVGVLTGAMFFTSLIVNNAADRNAESGRDGKVNRRAI